MTDAASPTMQFITPELPPAQGGVADYAALLAAHWPGGEPRDWWVAKGAETASRLRPDWRVRELSAEARRPAWPERGTLFVHYTQYGFSAAGVPWRLVRGLRRWRKGGEARRLAVFFHETWLTGPPWKRRGLIAPLARLCARELARVADVRLTNCVKHARQLAGVARAFEVAPVPSNIPVGTLVRRREDEVSALRVVVFGLPETRLRALRAHRAFLLWLNRRSNLRELVLLGGGEERDRFARAGLALAESLVGARVRRAAARSPGEIGAELSAADIGLTGYAADEIGKSGTLAAYFTHGCPVACAGHDAGGLGFDFSAGADAAPLEWRVWRDAGSREQVMRYARQYAAEQLDWPAYAKRVAAATSAVADVPPLGAEIGYESSRAT